MHIIDFNPSKGSFSPGQVATFLIELETTGTESVTLKIFIRHFDEQIAVIERTIKLVNGEQIIQVEWMPPAKPAGYSAQLEIVPGNIRAATAFDVLSSWTDFPRYGFLSDFSASRPDPESTLNKLTRYHLNGLQFYDWQYRHDQLLSTTETYIDPLGRQMSLDSVRSLVHAAHQHGMVAMPYLAIYAASVEFWRTHPDWALYDQAEYPIAFGENFLGLMDPSQGSPWSQHLLGEGTRTLENIPFDGLHIDQYGDPKQAWDSKGNPVDLPKAFVNFIQSASDQHPDQTILFNAVGNWPIEALADSVVDFLYIEVWSPDVEYRHLAKIVLNAVRLSHGKAVVIALYLPANRPANNLLADALILACGGTRIELGEDARLLSDPYFPKHEEITPDFSSELRKLSDFAVRNGEWLMPYNLSAVEREKWSQSELDPGFISTDIPLWTVARRHPEGIVVHVVNFSSLDASQRWDEAHPAPTLCEEATLRIQIPDPPVQVFWDCPEQLEGPHVMGFEYSDGTLTVKIPQINITGLIAIYD